MGVKCEHCGNEMNENDPFCPFCRTKNPSYVAETLDTEGTTYNEVPKTIEELKTWYANSHLPPPEVTRFFIGEDYKGSRAFGIFYDFPSESYVVYKNKGNGERAIRYQGQDEAFAVKELYQRLQEEIVNQKSHSSIHSRGSSLNSQAAKRTGCAIIGIFLAMFLSPFIIMLSAIFFTPSDGYYEYNDYYYYKQGSSWYRCYDSGWRHVTPERELKKHYNDYYISKTLPDYTFEQDKTLTKFEDTSYYSPYSSSSSNYYDDDDDDSWSSSSSDWDSSSSWDSSSTDWDSDW